MFPAGELTERPNNRTYIVVEFTTPPVCVKVKEVVKPEPDVVDI